MNTKNSDSLLTTKDLYNKAIDLTGLLSKGQKEILKYMLSFDQVRGVTSDAIQKKAEITRQAAAIHLNKLITLGFVTRKKTRVYVYFIKFQRIKDLVEDYNIINNSDFKV